jgi:hypothetical protein
LNVNLNLKTMSEAAPNELDMMMRVVDPFYDLIWSWTQTFDTTKALEKLKKRAYEPSGSTTSTILDSGILELSMTDKIALLEKKLKKVKKEFKDEFFQDVTSAMNLNKGIYPGIADVDFIARYLFREGDAYKHLLSTETTKRLTTANVFKHLFYSVAKFLLQDSKGTEAMKYVVVPNRVQNATYDICRKRFCALLVEETSVVPYALVKLAKELNGDAPAVTTKDVESKPTVSEPLMEPLEEALVEPVKESVKEPAKEPVKEPVAELPPVEPEPEDPVDDPVAVPEEEDSVKDAEEDPEEASAETEQDVEPQEKQKDSPPRRRKTRRSPVDFSTPLGMAMSSLWSHQDAGWPPMMMGPRSIAPSLKSYHALSSDEDNDSD